MTDIEEKRTAMAEAFDVNKVPATMPAGAGTTIIDQRPRGAMKLEVVRDEAVVLRKVKTIAMAAGDEFFYRWPAKNKDGSVDWIEGPSVKCTNAVARLFGNCGVAVRAEDRGDHWMLSAQFLDFETGYALERPYNQRKGQNVGSRMDAARALDIVFQIGVSKATRNVVCNALSDFVDYAFLEAKEAIVGKIGKEPDRYRARILSRLQELKIDPKRVEAMRGRTADKWLAPDMALIVAEIQAINDNMADPEEVWPSQTIEAPAPKPQPESYVAKGDKQPETRERADSGEKPEQRERAPTDQKPVADKRAEEKEPSIDTERADVRQEPVITERKDEDAQPQNNQREDGDGDRQPSSFEAANRMVTALIEVIINGSMADFPEAKKRGRASIDAYEGLTDDERDVLRGRFTTGCLEYERSRAKGKGRGR